MGRVVHFEIHADDPQRAIAFYETVFGWQFTSWGEGIDYYPITTGPDGEPGINGGLLRRHEGASGDRINSFVCTVQVESVDETLAKALASGGALALPKMPIPGIGFLAYCKDTEGNIFGIMHADPSATAG